jgi:hypothetical protein
MQWLTAIVLTPAAGPVPGVKASSTCLCRATSQSADRARVW